MCTNMHMDIFIDMLAGLHGHVHRDACEYVCRHSTGMCMPVCHGHVAMGDVAEGRLQKAFWPFRRKAQSRWVNVSCHRQGCCGRSWLSWLWASMSVSRSATSLRSPTATHACMYERARARALPLGHSLGHSLGHLRPKTWVDDHAGGG